MTVNAPTVEIGYAHAPQYSWWLYTDETTIELQWPQSIQVYDAMRRTDSQVTSVLEAMSLLVRQTSWRIDPAGARQQVTEHVADDMGLPIVGQPKRVPPRSRDRFSWPEHLRLALLMLPFGHAFFEQQYRVEGSGNPGDAHLKKLNLRPSKTIDQIDVAPDGGLISIRQQWTITNSEPKPIPVNRLVAYIHKREGGNWLGQSILRPAYKNWLLKDRLLRVQAQTIERNGMGIPLYKAADGGTTAQQAEGLAMAKSWRAGEAAGSAVPFGADLVLRGVEGTLPDAEPAIRYHDEQIGRAVLAHFLNLGTQTGSWALGTTFADFFTLSLQTLAQQIADTATMHVVEDIVDVNWGPDEPAPRLVFDEIGSRQAATAQAIKLLIDAGVIQPDEVLEGTARQQYGLPPKDSDTTRTPPGSSGAGEEPTAMGAQSVAAGGVGPKVDAHDADLDDETDDWLDDIEALTAALDAFSGRVRAADWNPADHPRGPGGRFRSTFDRVMNALTDHHKSGGKADSATVLKDFDREQVRRVAKTRGIALKRGASEAEIKRLLVEDAKPGGPDVPEEPEAPVPAKASPEPSDLDRQIADAEARVRVTQQRLAKAQAAFDAASRDPKAEALGEFFPLGTGGSGGGRQGSTDAQLRRYVEARKARDAAQSQHIRAEAQLKELVARRGAAGKFSREKVSAGDAIKVQGTWWRVQKANGKTVQVDAGPGMDVKYRWDQVTDHRPAKARPEPDAVEPDAETAARVRQSAIDDARKVGDLVAEVSEVLNNGADTAVLRRTVEQHAQRLGTPDRVRDSLLRAIGTGDPEIQAENKIREAYRGLARNPNSHVMLADLRERSGVDRQEFDAALVRLSTGQLAAVHLAPQEDQKRLTPRLRDASIRHGDENMHMVAFEDPSPRPDPLDSAKIRAAVTRAARAAKLTPVGVAGKPARFDRKLHEAIGDPIPDGAHVEVVRPGYTLDRDGETVQLSKAVVEVADEPAPRKRAPAKKAAPRKVKPADIGNGLATTPPGTLSKDELVALQLLSAKGYPAAGGWVNSTDVTVMHRQHLDALVEKGWVQKHIAPGGEKKYRIDPQSVGSSQKANKDDGAALVGDVLPASRPVEPRLSLGKVHTGAILDGYRDPGDPSAFGNVPEDGSADPTRVMRFVVQRIERVDENGDPTTALLATHRRIVGHDTTTGARVTSAPVPVGSYWSWLANPEADAATPDIEGEIVPDRVAVDAPAPKARAVGRDLLAAGNIDDFAAEVAADATKGGSRTGSGIMAAIASRQGFDRPPVVATKREVDTLVTAGHRELWRGTIGNPGLSAADQQEQLRTGPAHWGNGGFGNGIYFVDDLTSAGEYADWTPGSMVRAVLDRDAKVISWSDLEARHKRFREEHGIGGGDTESVFEEPANYAAALGYDAISGGDVHHGAGTEEIVVLNRSALTISTEDPLADLKPDADVPEVDKQKPAPRRKAAPKATPANVAAPEPVSPAISGRDISAEVDYVSLPAVYDLATHSDTALVEIIKRQGFDAPPAVVTGADFDAAVKRGEVRETWRGVGRHGGGTPASELAERYRTGDFYIGLGINGNGTYVASRRQDAAIYEGGGTGGGMLRIGLRADARVISADDLDAEMDAFFAQHRPRANSYLAGLDRRLLADLAKAKTPRRIANIRREYRAAVQRQDRDRSLEVQRDPGRFAALRGYDAIEIPKDRSPDKHAEWIILNRSATIVQEAS